MSQGRRCRGFCHSDRNPALAKWKIFRSRIPHYSPRPATSAALGRLAAYRPRSIATMLHIIGTSGGLLNYKICTWLIDFHTKSKTETFPYTRAIRWYLLSCTGLGCGGKRRRRGRWFGCWNVRRQKTLPLFIVALLSYITLGELQV